MELVNMSSVYLEFSGQDTAVEHVGAQMFLSKGIQSHIDTITLKKDTQWHKTSILITYVLEELPGAVPSFTKLATVKVGGWANVGMI